MFYLAKTMQAAALGIVGLALYVGLSESHVTRELTMMSMGVVLFLAGRLAERIGS